jgi:hypothetical protein
LVNKFEIRLRSIIKTGKCERKTTKVKDRPTDKILNSNDREDTVKGTANSISEAGVRVPLKDKDVCFQHVIVDSVSICGWEPFLEGSHPLRKAGFWREDVFR